MRQNWPISLTCARDEVVETKKKRKRKKSYNFTTFARRNSWGDHHEFYFNARSYKCAQLCKIWARSVNGFLAGGSPKNALSHWKCPSPLQHCLTLSCENYSCYCEFIILFMLLTWIRRCLKHWLLWGWNIVILDEAFFNWCPDDSFTGFTAYEYLVCSSQNPAIGDESYQQIVDWVDWKLSQMDRSRRSISRISNYSRIRFLALKNR